MRAHHALALAIVLAAAPAFADEEEGEELEHHHDSNRVALFTGATSGLTVVSPARFTFGATYERRLDFVTHKLGAGALIDSAYAAGDLHSTIAAFLSLHPIGGLMALGGFGTNVLGLGHNPVLAVRLATAYFFPIGRLSLGPVVNADYVDTDTYVVYGLSAGVGF
jgi:hypothetical protein